MKREPEPEYGEEEEKSSKPKKEEKPLEEIEYEDKVLLVNPIGADYNIYVIHQLAQRNLREHIAKSFKDFLPEL